jgi:uncharacterized protein with ParB-like and HNH nuclease domain
MNCQKIELLELFKQPIQFIVFDPKRKYSWTKDHCRNIWDRISGIEKGNTEEYFSGAIIYAEQGIFEKSSVSSLVLLDGLQRLTTCTLLLAAARNYLEGIHEIPLINYGHDDNLRYKLIPSEYDQKSLFNIIDGLEKEPERNSLLYDNYYYFKAMIDTFEGNKEEIFKMISKIKVMDVSIDKRYENPGEIYEGINATGLDEVQRDLIRNWLGLLKSVSKKQ